MGCGRRRTDRWWFQALCYLPAVAELEAGLFEEAAEAELVSRAASL
jgi:hypothetical protein